MLHIPFFLKVFYFFLNHIEIVFAKNYTRVFQFSTDYMFC